jgi:hypothetical protein
MLIHTHTHGESPCVHVCGSTGPTALAALPRALRGDHADHHAGHHAAAAADAARQPNQLKGRSAQSAGCPRDGPFITAPRPAQARGNSEHPALPQATLPSSAWFEWCPPWPCLVLLPRGPDIRVMAHVTATNAWVLPTRLVVVLCLCTDAQKTNNRAVTDQEIGHGTTQPAGQGGSASTAQQQQRPTGSSSSEEVAQSLQRRRQLGIVALSLGLLLLVIAGAYLQSMLLYCVAAACGMAGALLVAGVVGWRRGVAAGTNCWWMELLGQRRSAHLLAALWPW